MKTDSRHHLTWGARGILFARLLGVTALFALLIGVFVLSSRMTEPNPNIVREAIAGKVDPVAQVGAYAGVAGLGIVVLWAILEFTVAFFGAGRKSAAALSAGLQLGLAFAATAGVVYLLYQYPKSWDLTREKTFTLPESVAQKQRALSGGTTIVVFQQHNVFGQLSPKRDIYEYAAERKIAQKVRDDVDKFRQLGPKFRVVELDAEDVNYEEKLKEATAERPGLKEAIAVAPENSIFIYADDLVRELTTADAEALLNRSGDRKPPTVTHSTESTKTLVYTGQNIPRLSFNEYYLLDKTASMEDNPFQEAKPRRNLVLQRQGVDALARRILSIQEKKPKVGLLVIHEWLTTKFEEGGQEQFTARGLRKSLENYGFEVVDVVMKRWEGRGEPTPAAYTLEETELERLEAELEGIDDDLRSLKEDRDSAEAFYKLFKEATLDELNKKFRQRVRQEITEAFRQEQLRSVSDAMVRMAERAAELDRDKKATDSKIQALMKKERAFEDRRITDVRTKLRRTLADCDLLIIPRHTLINTASRQAIDSSIYRMSAEQVDVVKEFMKAGKPVLACLGPTNSADGAPNDGQPLDDFERLLADRGVELGRQTVLFDVESKGFASRQAGNLLGGSGELPPVSFPETPRGKNPNPIAEAMRVTARSTGQALDIRVRHPRPIYVSPAMANKLPFAAEFLSSSSGGWNEAQPFPTMRQVGPREMAVTRPRFEATPFDDPKKGTLDEERRGPFPLGVAIDGPLPVEWYDAKFSEQTAVAAMANTFDGGLLSACLTAETTVRMKAKQLERQASRLVVIGHGGWFLGKQMGAAQEQLLLHTCNWLLHRDERLPRIETPATNVAQAEATSPTEWKYHRIAMSREDSWLWRNGAVVLLPGAFLYIGMMVWIVRRVR